MSKIPTEGLTHIGNNVYTIPDITLNNDYLLALSKAYKLTKADIEKVVRQVVTENNTPQNRRLMIFWSDESRKLFHEEMKKYIANEQGRTQSNL